MTGWMGNGASISGHHTRQSKMSTPNRTVPSFQCFNFMASTSFLSAGDTLSPDLGIAPSIQVQRLKSESVTNFFRREREFVSWGDPGEPIAEKKAPN